MRFNQRKGGGLRNQGLTTYTAKFCHVCCAPNSLSFCKCRAIFYCTPAHAELDKLNHDSYCVLPLYNPRKALMENPGVTLVACKNLLPGETILTEYPLLCSPTDNALDGNRFSPCLGCCVRIVATKRKRDPKLNVGINKCSSCGWPVCNRACEKAYQHAANECGYFKENSIKYPPSNGGIELFRSKYFLYKAVIVLRSLLWRKRDPLSFQEFLKLPARRNLDTLRLTKTHDKLIIKLLHDFQASVFLPSDPVAAEEELAIILNRICLYGFSKPISNRSLQYAPNKGLIDAVYRCGSVIKRACDSNVTWAIGDGPDFVLQIRAVKPIRKNEVLVLPFSNDLYMKDTPQRQEHIMKVIGASCKCLRCSDGTEFGSYLSAIKCNECNNGYLLPCNQDKKTTALFVCNLDNRHRIDNNKIYDRVKEIWKISSDIIRSSCAPDTERKTEVIISSPSNSDELKFHIKRLQTDGFLHPNHSILFRLVWEVVKMDIYFLSSFDWPELSDFIGHCEYLVKIEELIGQVYSSNRAILYFYIGRAFYQQYELSKSQNAVSNQNMFSSSDTLPILENIMNLYDEARKFFKDGGHEIGRIIHEDMKTIVSLINKYKKGKIA